MQLASPQKPKGDNSKQGKEKCTNWCPGETHNPLNPIRKHPGWQPKDRLPFKPPLHSTLDPRCPQKEQHANNPFDFCPVRVDGGIQFLEVLDLFIVKTV
jgi:hypothetical protein